MSASELKSELSAVNAKLAGLSAKGLKLDLTRGKPGAEQLALSEDMLTVLSSLDDCVCENGTDCANYGILDGIPEAKKLFSDLLGIPENRIIVEGNSSLNIMFDTVARAMLFGVYGSESPWCRQGEIKFLCPSPGYDRHFAICEAMGIKMIPVDMTPEGPDMDTVERLVSSDSSIKGIWCVPKYSNPGGITYSPETVQAFAALKPAADDFRIFWDNAYMAHGFRQNDDYLVNIFDECRKLGSEDMVYEFMSTSKVTFSGAGVAVLAASKKNIDFLLKQMSVQTLGYDKLNQMRHVRFFKNVEGLMAHMKKQADYLRPKFDCTLAALDSGLDATGVGRWSRPNGGYFISFDGLKGTAKRCVKLCGELGVKLTDAGATFPYGIDPEDKNIRIAPSFPQTEQLYSSMRVFCLCQRMAALEVLLADNAQ